MTKLEPLPPYYSYRVIKHPAVYLDRLADRPVPATGPLVKKPTRRIRVKKGSTS